MTYTLRLASPPFAEPVTVDEVKAAARISIDAEDETIAGWIKAARELAENFQRRAYITQTWDLFFDTYPPIPIYLPRAPYQKVDTIKIVDYTGTQIDLYRYNGAASMQSDFVFDWDSQPARITLAYGKSWPSTTLQSIGSVWIQYIAGYGDTGADTPATVKDAIALWCAWRNENRTAEVDAPESFYNILRPDRLYL